MVLIYLWEKNLLVWITKWKRQTQGSLWWWSSWNNRTKFSNISKIFRGPELRLSADIKHGSGYNLVLRQHCWHGSRLSKVKFTMHKDHVKTMYIYIAHWTPNCATIPMCLEGLSAYILCVKVLKCLKLSTNSARFWKKNTITLVFTGFFNTASDILHNCV